ncbi:hypothetical protein CAAN1_15S03422 [[Candida] anglica]|uniref:Uncharacterized protein n=1 Tax=[Candida] anglica TaxID=148631 RepID=A0ABP0E9G4_9ASCO
MNLFSLVIGGWILSAMVVSLNSTKYSMPEIISNLLVTKKDLSPSERLQNRLDVFRQVLAIRDDEVKVDELRQFVTDRGIGLRNGTENGLKMGTEDENRVDRKDREISFNRGDIKGSEMVLKSGGEKEIEEGEGIVQKINGSTLLEQSSVIGEKSEQLEREQSTQSDQKSSEDQSNQSHLPGQPLTSPHQPSKDSGMTGKHVQNGKNPSYKLSVVPQFNQHARPEEYVPKNFKYAKPKISWDNSGGTSLKGNIEAISSPEPIPEEILTRLELPVRGEGEPELEYLRRIYPDMKKVFEEKGTSPNDDSLNSKDDHLADNPPDGLASSPPPGTDGIVYEDDEYVYEYLYETDDEEEESYEEEVETTLTLPPLTATDSTSTRSSLLTSHSTMTTSNQTITVSKNITLISTTSTSSISVSSSNSSRLSLNFPNTTVSTNRVTTTRTITSRTRAPDQFKDFHQGLPEDGPRGGKNRGRLRNHQGKGERNNRNHTRSAFDVFRSFSSNAQRKTELGTTQWAMILILSIAIYIQ